jgi:hypothetical protein
MGAWGRSIRRLAGAGVIALALTAAGVVGPELGRGGCGQPGAPCSAFGYAPPPGGLAAAGQVPVRPVAGWLPALLPGGAEAPLPGGGMAWPPGRGKEPDPRGPAGRCSG